MTIYVNWAQIRIILENFPNNYCSWLFNGCKSRRDKENDWWLCWIRWCIRSLRKMTAMWLCTNFGRVVFALNMGVKSSWLLLSSVWLMDFYSCFTPTIYWMNEFTINLSEWLRFISKFWNCLCIWLESDGIHLLSCDWWDYTLVTISLASLLAISRVKWGFLSLLVLVLSLLTTWVPFYVNFFLIDSLSSNYFSNYQTPHGPHFLFGLALMHPL